MNQESLRWDVRRDASPLRGMRRTARVLWEREGGLEVLKGAGRRVEKDYATPPPPP